MRTADSHKTTAGCWLMVLGFGAFVSLSLPATANSKISLSGRSVTEVVADYEAVGYRFLYSTGLVRPSLHFGEQTSFLATDVAIGDDPAIVHLKIALSQIGLALRGNGQAWRIVRAPVQQLVSSEPEQKALVELEWAPPLEEVVVVSSRYAVKDSTTRAHLLDMQVLESVPTLGEDPMRVTSHLPGTAVSVSAKPHIRGGLQDELLVLFNNIELLEPFHLRDFQSVFSSFSSVMIDSIDVYTGGFPARYGDRMSGVMDISPAAATRAPGGELSLSLLNAGAAAHGSFDNQRGTWLASARRGNLDILTEQINPSVGSPSYNDWFAQARYEFDDATELDVGLFGYNDNIRLSDFEEDGEVARSRYRNIYGWAQLHRRWGARLDGSTLLYAGRIQHDRAGLLIDDELDNGYASVDDRRKFQVVSLAQTFRFQPSASLYAEFGGRVNWQTGRYDYQGVIKRGLLAQFLNLPESIQRSERLRPGGGSGGVFGSVRYSAFERWNVEAGVRWDWQNYGAQGESQISPRLSLKYDVSPYSELRVSAGRFFQSEAIHELQLGDGINQYQEAQHADHFILGWHQRFGESAWSLRAEMYAKNFHNPKRRFENVFNPMVLLPELAADRVEVAPQRARARGVEATLKYRPSTDLMAWLSLAHSEVEDYEHGRWQPRVWDQGGTLSAGFSWDNQRWSVSAAMLWHDGWRTNRLPSQIATEQELRIDRNSDRLRDYFSLDLRVARTWRWQKQSLTAFLEITNVLNRHNLGGVEYDVEEFEIGDEGEAGGYEIIANDEALLPLVPSLGVRWRF